MRFLVQKTTSDLPELLKTAFKKTFVYIIIGLHPQGRLEMEWAQAKNVLDF